MKSSGEDAAKSMQSALNEEGHSLFSKDEFRTPGQINSFFGTLASKQKLEKAISELAVEVPLCTISIKIAGNETEVHLCDVDIVQWLNDLKINSLKTIAKQLGIFKNIKEKANINCMRNEIATHVTVCKAQH